MKNPSPFGEFVWFKGVVEDVKLDPKTVGRVRVRCIGYHTEDLAELPTDLLPWASVMHGSAAMSPSMMKPGDWVVGFFLDGKEAQQPMVMGWFDAIPTNRGVEGEGFSDPEGIYPRQLNMPTLPPSALGNTHVSDYKKKTAWGNPVEFAPTYPYNHVMQPDWVNMIEIDDTPGKERIHVFHHKGSYVEFLPDGTIVVRSVKDRWDVTFGSHTMLVNGNLDIGATGDVAIKAGGSLKLSAGGSLMVAAGGELGLGAGGAGSFVSGGTLGLKGSKLDAQGSASDVTGGPDAPPGPPDVSAYVPPEPNGDDGT